MTLSRYSVRGQRSKSLAERFWEKVDKSGPCWLWRAGLFPNGYGSFGAGGKHWRAHRWAYTQTYGPIPDGLEIDHKCRVRNCVRPSHLQAVTKSLNHQNRSGARRDSTSGVRNVQWHKQSGTWRVVVTVNGVNHSAGHFRDLDEAAAAAAELRRRYMPNSLIDHTKEHQ